MKNKDLPIATTIIQMQKQSIKRIYILLIIQTLFLFASVVDSCYQRERIEDIIKSIEVVEETSTEEYNQTIDNVQEISSSTITNGVD